MKNKKILTIELSIYILLFLFAIIFRLVNLYVSPLSDGEALISLQALTTSGQFDIYQIKPHQTLLVNFLTINFLMFGSKTIFVRLLPVFAGSILVFMPYFFRKQIGKTTAVVLAVWLSFDPLLYFLSRKVDSTILSLLFLLFAFLFFRDKKWIGFGVVMALGVLSGQQFLIGLFLFFVSTKFSKLDVFNVNENGQVPITWKPGIFAFITTIVLVGTIGFIYPSQFGSVLSGLVNLVTAYPGQAGIPLANLFAGLLFYEMFVVVLGLLGLFFFWQKHPIYGKFTAIWLGLSFILNLIYPIHTVSMLIWFILPLGVMMVWLTKSTINLKGVPIHFIGIFSCLLFVFLVYIFMLIFSVNMSGYQIAGIEINSSVVGTISIVIFALAVIMIGWAWSWELAKQSLLIAIGVGFVISSISSAWNVGGGRVPYHNELWNMGLLSPDTDLFLQSINELREINGLDKQVVQIYIQNIDSPSLIWELREYDIRSFTTLPEILDVELIITYYESENQVYGPYRGQDYLLKSKPAWNLMNIREWKNWYLSRRAPQDGIAQEQIIIWVNNDWFATNPAQN